MEQEIKIKISKTKLHIYGKLRGSLKKPLIVLVHGLSGEMDERLIYHAALWFEKKGFATFRFNQYDWHNNARSMSDSTLVRQAKDVDMVLLFFSRRGVKKIFLVGHSYGGPTILLARKANVSAIALWDPSYRINLSKSPHGMRPITRVKRPRGYIHHWGIDVFLGEKIVQESKRLAWDQLARGLTVPLKIIVAATGYERGEKYFKHSKGPKELVLIKGASHQFVEDGISEKLFQETLTWFRKYR